MTYPAPGEARNPTASATSSGWATRPRGTCARISLQSLLSECCEHIRFDQARGDHVHRDRAACDLPGHRTGQPDQAGFGGRVVGLAGGADERADRGDHDDPATMEAEHLGQRRAWPPGRHAGRLVSMTSSQASSPIRSTRVSRVMPALATSTSTGPKRSSIGGEGRLHLAGIGHVAGDRQEAVRSLGAGPPSACATARSRPPGRPLARNHCAQARPMPRDPPVTSTTRLRVPGRPVTNRAPGRSEPRQRVAPRQLVRRARRASAPVRRRTGCVHRSARPCPPGRRPPGASPAPRPVRFRVPRWPRRVRCSPSSQSSTSGSKIPGGGAHDDPFGREEMLSLVDRRRARQLVGTGHRVHQTVEVGGDRDGDAARRSGMPFAAPFRSARRPARPRRLRSLLPR